MSDLNAEIAKDKKPGAMPGTLFYEGEVKQEKIRIRSIFYNEQELLEKEYSTIEDCLADKSSKGIRWINIDGLHDTALIAKLGKAYDVHALTLEDIVHTKQRSKIENFDHYDYVVMKMVYLTENAKSVLVEQMSFLLFKDCVISFQERVGDVFEPLRNRIRNSKGVIRKVGSDYLLYALIDSIVDHYFVVLENIEERIEMIDDALLQGADQQVLREIHDLRREVVQFKKTTWPLRELTNALLRDESKLIKKSTKVFIRDVYDHTVQILDTLESQRDTVTGLLEMYQSSVGNKMNEVMKVLTIIATLFIPPTFVAGIYGMNFDNMPELHTQTGYFVALSVMGVSILGMLSYFKKKDWF